MTRYLQTLAVLTAALLANGCEKHEKVQPPPVRFNPAAAYDETIVLDVDRNVADILRISGNASYTIRNAKECVPLDHTLAIGGTRPHISQSVPVEVEEQHEGGFHIYYQSHPYLDENYYGLGECRWAFTGVFLILDGRAGSQKLIVSKKSMDTGAAQRYCFIGNYSTCMGREAIPKNSDREIFVVTLHTKD